jgi:NADH-quinone oxidoreductase subunit I
MSTTPQIYDVEPTALAKGGGDVIVVQRKEDQVRLGQGMVKGMLTVIKHFGKSFTNRIEDKNDTAGMFTVEYPEERMELPEAFRNMPILLYDDKTGQELCTSCFQCERVCPPKVIHITQARNPDTGKPVPAAEEFVIEYDSCMSCGYCHEICPFDAIKMDHMYELSTADHLSMDVHKKDLNRPISYYQTIAPNLWAEVEAGAMKKLQNNIKRRPGTIGVAPHMVGKTQQAAPAAQAAGAKRTVAAPAAPVAAAGKNMSDDKRARLEAIRAAKRAQGGAAPAEEATAAPTPAAEAKAPSAPAAAVGKNMSDDKRARLEAIRAAKRAQNGGEAPAAEVAPAAEAQEPTAPVAAVGQNMPEDKRARLEAIRAAKRAQREQGGE